MWLRLAEFGGRPDVSLVQAFMWNCRNLSFRCQGRDARRGPSESADVKHWDGAAGSRNSVMGIGECQDKGFGYSVSIYAVGWRLVAIISNIINFRYRG